MRLGRSRRSPDEPHKSAGAVLLKPVAYVVGGIFVIFGMIGAIFASLIVVTQNRFLSMLLGGSDVIMPVRNLGVDVRLRVASSSPIGAAEYYRTLVVRLADGRSVAFPLPDDWGGIGVLSIYSTGTHLRVLDCTTGFDVDLKSGEQVGLRDGYAEDAVDHVGSFVKGRGVEVSATEPIALKAIAMSC